MDFEVTGTMSSDDGMSFGVMNTTEMATSTVGEDPQVRGLMRELSRWVATNRGGTAKSGMFDRTAYSPPDNPYDQMRAARLAMREDDIVGGVADVTESLAFRGGLKWESADPDDADIFNQLSADLNLDDVIRSMWRDTFALDQTVMVRMWGWKELTVRGVTAAGSKRKKKYRLWAPTALKQLNPEFTVPIGWGALREDNLAWMATPNEMDLFDGAYLGTHIDPLMTAFFTGVYQAGQDEQSLLANWNVNTSQLLKMNPAWVFRHCHTKPDYQLFPDIRLRNVFPLLDMKRQLMASDRAALIGSANYILLIRKGDKDSPAESEEIANLKQGFQFLAKLPVIITDHRLQIDIITPKLEFVLKSEHYDVLDHRILMRVLAGFLPPGIRTFDAPSWNDQIAASVQNRRHMLKRTLESQLARVIVEHPNNEGVFNSRPSLVFTPRNVRMGADGGETQALLALRTQREISRDTILEHVGLDEATEAQRMQYEEEHFDSVFKTQIPFAAPGAQPSEGTPNGAPEAPMVSGGRGGRPPGGGSSTKSPAKIAKPKAPSGQPIPEEK